MACQLGTLKLTVVYGRGEKVNFRSQILERPSIGKYWNILCVPVLSGNVIFTSFRTCWWHPEANNTGTPKWSSIVQYSCTSIWDLKFTFSDHNIDGIQIDQNNCIKLSCYADCLTCFVKDANSAHKIFQILNDFYSCSSLKVNNDKTEAMWLGSKRWCKEKPLNVVWTDNVKVLGIAQDKNP